MKFKFSALAFSLASLAIANFATDLPAKTAQLLSKDPVIKSFFSASDSAAQIFTGPSTSTSPLPSFIRLTFTQDLHHRGHAIKSNGDQFRLKEGTYRVSFTGTLNNNNNVPGVNNITYDMALQLGSKFIFINTDSEGTPLNNTTNITSFTRIVKVDDEHKDLSIVIRNRTFNGPITVTTRTIAIEKLK